MALGSFAGSPSVQCTSPPGPTALENQYAEYPKPDPSSNTRLAPIARASSSTVIPTCRPTMGNPRSSPSRSISSSTGSSWRSRSDRMYASSCGSTTSIARMLPGRLGG
jgi:hypothetical protein